MVRPDCKGFVDRKALAVGNKLLVGLHTVLVVEGKE
jgi:hypothetical protein